MLSTAKIKRYKRKISIAYVSKVYVHILNVLSKVDLTEKEILTTFRENPPKPFEFVRDIAEYLGFENVKGVKFEDTFFDEEDIIIEYSIEFNGGRVCVRIICSKTPYKTFLKKYYEKYNRSLDQLFVAISIALVHVLLNIITQFILLLPKDFATIERFHFEHIILRN